MTKVKWAVSSRKRRKKTLKATEGHQGSRSRLIRTAKESLRKALVCSYYDRKKKKGNFRALWINRINAACGEEEISYSRFMSGLKKAGIILNRKMLAEIAATDSRGIKALIKKVQ